MKTRALIFTVVLVLTFFVMLESYAEDKGYYVPEANEEITGKVTVTEISGMPRVADAATLKLSDSPVFVEID